MSIPATSHEGLDAAQSPRQAVQQLVRYAQMGPPARELPQAFSEFFGPDAQAREIPGGSTGALFVEWFLFDRPMSSGETPARQYALASPALSADQRRAFFDLAESVPGFFEVVGFGSGGMWLSVFPAPGERRSGETGAGAVWVEEPAAARRLARGDVIWTRLLRWRGRWHLATCCFVLPSSAQDLLRPLVRLRPRYSDRAWRALMGRLQPQFFRDLIADSDEARPLAPRDALPLSAAERRYYLMDAQASLRRGLLRLALQRYWRILADCPLDLEARLGVARIRARQGRVAAAERAFRSVLGDHPDNPEALSGLGRLLEARGALREAERLLKRLDDLGAADTEALVSMGRIALRKGSAARALAYFTRALELAKAARRSKGLRAGTQEDGVALEAGWELLESGYARESRVFFTHACTSARSRQTRASAWHGLGESLAREKRWLEGAAALLTALRLGLGQPKLWAEVGRLFARGGRLRDAEAAYRSSAARLPGYVEGLAGLAGVMLRQNRVGEALRMARRAQAIAPDDPQVLRVLGACYLRKGAARSALEVLDRALALDPRNVNTRSLRQRAFEVLTRPDRRRQVGPPRRRGSGPQGL
ncbi:MAG: tetratricopeptide repeat protein [Bacillota bacterium]